MIPTGTVRSFASVIEGRERGEGAVDVVTFFEDPYYLGIRTNTARFANQRVILKAAFGLKLQDHERAWLTEMHAQGRTNWTPDMEGVPFKITLLEVGQRSGKSFLAAGVSLYLYYLWTQYDDPHTEWLRAKGKQPIGIGSRIEIKQVATSKQNAQDHVFGETVAFIEHSPWARDHFRVEHDVQTMRIRGKKGMSILAGACTARGIRGGTSIMVILDELSWMVDTKGNVGGQEIYRAMRNTTKTTDGLIFCISSPRTDTDKLVALGKQAKAGELAAFWMNLPTWVMDPSQSIDDYEEERRTDPEGWDRDFNARASQALEAYFRMPTLIEAMLTRLKIPGGFVAPEIGVSIHRESDFHEVLRDYILSPEYPVKRNVEYLLAGDPSETNDAFGYSLMHRTKGGMIDVDLVGRFIPGTGSREIDAIEIKTFFMALVRKFAIGMYVDDKWGYQETRQAIRDSGAGVYDRTLDILRAGKAKEAIYTGQVRCWMLPQLKRELLSIELVNGKKIDFPKKEGERGHGDIAYALLQGIAELVDQGEGHIGTA